MVQITISKSTLERLEQDAKHFEKKIGIPYTYDDTLIEYFKILDSLK